MNAKELRIANLVNINNPLFHPTLKDVVLSVTGISQTIGLDGESTYSVSLEHINQDRNRYYETYSQFIEFIEPIPLTEEWLERMGFDKKGDEEWTYHTKKLHNDKYCELSLIEEYEEDIPDKSKILVCIFPYAEYFKFKFVHQIQNVYFDLTGEELTLNK